MKKLFILLLLLIGTVCYAIEPLTDEVIYQANSDLLVKYVIKQEKELEHSSNFNKDFEVFYLNLVKIGNYIGKTLDIDITEQNKYEYATITGTDLFLVSDADWTFAVPNTVYLNRRYYYYLDNFWKSFFDILNNGVYYGVLDNRWLTKKAVFSDYIQLNQLKRFYNKDWLDSYVQEYDWYINQGSYKDEGQ